MVTPAFVPFGGANFQAKGVDEAAVTVLPLPYECAPSYGIGSATGPYHILDASTQMEAFDEELCCNWTQLPIFTARPPLLARTPEKALTQIQAAAAAILHNNKPFLALGGDHAVSIGLLREVARLHPDAAVLQIDAHLDLRHTWNGSTLNHACVMRRVADDIGLDFAQAGIRSFSAEEWEIVRQRGYKPFLAHEMDAEGRWMQELMDRLPDKVYLTLDLDGLDPSEIPGTGTPEPGGLTYRQTLALIRLLAKQKTLISADVVELAAFAGSQVSQYTAARLCQKILLHCFGKHIC
ncbi:MAG: agmatinase [Desulfatibacillaceae bacterium]|nr:agmatinase [Desulfatibacillaceae bacterium]